MPVRERLERIESGARKKRGNDFEGGVFRGCADQRDDAVFDAVQERILLCLVEPVDFVDEEHGPPAEPGAVRLRTFDNLADILHAGGDRVELEKLRFCVPGDDPRQRRLSGPGRTPEDHRRDRIVLDQHAERLPLAEEVFLPYKPVERGRPYPLGKRGRIGRRG